MFFFLRIFIDHHKKLKFLRINQFSASNFCFFEEKNGDCQRLTNPLSKENCQFLFVSYYEVKLSLFLIFT